MIENVINPRSNWDSTSDNSLLRPRLKELYFALLEEQIDESTLEDSQQFLSQQLDRARHMTSDLPSEVEGLMDWMRSNTASVGEQYNNYLVERQNGGDRRYFPTKSHALHFLKAVAPTKLVDGAWLYGLVSQWRDPRYTELIRIYLEELGEGEAEKNHVLLYKKLLATNECTRWESLDEQNFMQGAIQLSLAQNASDFVPEIIGFNLGYEQLPLHLLICAHELNELGIDSYYFTLHVTVDNADTGHAARAVQSVTDAMPHLGDGKSFYERICDGYKLNSLGVGTNEIIANFDLKQELLSILATKASIGRQLHSDYCRIAGKTVNEWLAVPEQIQDFVEVLEKTGWLRRHEHPNNSRFWNLLVGEKATMFGVFNAYELQIIYDWIAGESLQELGGSTASYQHRRNVADVLPQASFLKLQRTIGVMPSWIETEPHENENSKREDLNDEFTSESNLLGDILAKASDKEAAMDLLVPWLSPIYHHTQAGLMATRIFTQGLNT